MQHYIKDNIAWWIGLSTDTKPISDRFGARFLEVDTLDRYIYTDSGWEWEVNLAYTSTHGYHYDAGTMDWVANTGGSGTGEEVEVTNFPATQPVSGTVSVEGGNANAVKVDGSAVTQPVSAATLPLPSGAATSALQSTLESLTDTLHELIQRLAPLGGAISMVGGQALRVSYGGGTFATSGPQTSAEFIATYHIGGRNWPFAVALHNLEAQINIDNVTAA